MLRIMNERLLTILFAALLLSACGQNSIDMEKTYSYDRQFLENKGIETVELSSPDGRARVLAVPAWQGRIATSTAAGEKGRSFGWINHKFIESGEVSPQFNNYGGEERFWLGPEGGENSWYFAKGAEQIFPNWKVPAPFDTETFETVAKSSSTATFGKDVTLVNAKGTEFRMRMQRKISLLDRKTLEDVLGIGAGGLQFVAYTSENTITNKGVEPWTEESGMPSVWMLGMFNPSETTTVFIPYDEEGEGRVVKDDYFGPMPEGRLKAENGVIAFSIDGKFRSKIGVSGSRTKGKVLAFDPQQGTLTLLLTAIPTRGARFVNSQWGVQDEPFGGDALNSYNDGPTEDGTVMGPFYEIESSSPAAALAPGESLTHVQTTVHFEGPAGKLKEILAKLL